MEGISKPNTINVLLIAEHGTGVRAISLPKNLLFALLLLFILTAVFFAWILCDYQTVKPRVANLKNAETLSSHHKEQIAYLGKRIQDMTEKLESLDAYHLALRSVAHMAADDEGGSLVGVGGSESGRIVSRLDKMGRETMAPERNREARSASQGAIEKSPGINESMLRASHASFFQRPRWPASGWVRSRFGTGSTALSGDRGFNRGVDIATKANATVLAPGDGVIAAVDWREGYGRRVVLAHGMGLVAVFSHLDRVFVRKGDWMRQGDAIATAGGTGKASGPYLHYEVHLYGIPVDPEQYLSSF